MQKIKKDMKEKKDPQRQNQSVRKWIALTGIGFEMGATIFICAWVGKKMDQYFETKKGWFTIGFVLLGVFISLYILVKQLQYLNKKNDP